MRVIEATARGESEGADFDQFYRDQFDRIARLAFVIVGDQCLAEELAQEALSRVQPGFDRLRAPVAYTRTVLMNLVKKHRGREARRRAAEAASGSLDAVSPEAAELLDVIDALPWRQKAVIVLRYFEDLSEADIAAALGCRPGTVKSLSARALDRLRKEVER